MMRLIVAAQAFFKILFHPELAERLREPQKIHSKSENTPSAAKEKREHLRILALLQRHGRLLDFLQEDISNCSDQQVGIAARQVHADCRQKLEEIVTIRPLLAEPEGATIDIPVGYDPAVIKVVGNVTSNPPYRGIVQHAGWKAHKLSLPAQQAELRTEVLAPAEVEVR